MRKSKKKWERLYNKAISMAREGKGSLYDRVKVLVEVAKDNEFVEDMASKNEKPMVFLSKVVEDSFTTFSELQTILINFPERESWMSGDLRSMRQELIEKMRGKEKKVEESDNSKIKMSWKARCHGKQDVLRKNVSTTHYWKHINNSRSRTKSYRNYLSEPGTNGIEQQRNVKLLCDIIITMLAM